ncbi:MAG: hypothetical protein CMJ27_11725 [Phycisphaerae bacterium]|nr:hypothetical protein [Phycisphaerae bacterium]OUX00385.1 MAG: hypothetical protein CBD91_06800 [Phycisphaeraceae bacterium TMED231]
MPGLSGWGSDLARRFGSHRVRADRGALAERREGVGRSTISNTIGRILKHQLRDAGFYRKTA